MGCHPRGCPRRNYSNHHNSKSFHTPQDLLRLRTTGGHRGVRHPVRYLFSGNRAALLTLRMLCAAGCACVWAQAVEEIATATVTVTATADADGTSHGGTRSRALSSESS